MFFWVSYAIRKWPHFREIIRNFSCHFSMQIYTKFWVFPEILWLFIPIFQRFITDDIFYTQQRNFKTLIGGGGGEVRQYTPQLGCLRHFVYSKFRIFRMFFLFCIPFENILFGSGFKFQFLLFLYSFNTQYSPRFQRQLLLVKFLFEGIQNFVWKSCQIIRNVV